MNIGGIMMLGISMVFVSMGFIFLPIANSAVETLMDYTYSAYTSITASTFTGFTSVVGVTPLLILVGFLMAAVVSGMMGVKAFKGATSVRADLGGLILNGLAIVFIAIGLIIMPVALDGASGLMAHSVETSESDSADTAVGVTTANYTLNQRLYNDSTAQVVSVTSNVTGDTAAVASYTNPKLYISGLSANETRTVVTTYNYADELASFTGYYAVLRIAPMLILIGFLSASVLAGFFGLRRLGSGE